MLSKVAARARAAAVGICVLAGPALAQPITVLECDWQSSARNIVEPWESNTRTFSNGQTRLALLDTIEPAAGWAWLLVLSPPYGEVGDRQCRVIGVDGMGFSGMGFEQLSASYDPATGLRFSLPAQRMGPEGDFVWGTLGFVLNQATGDIRGTWQR